MNFYSYNDKIDFLVSPGMAKLFISYSHKDEQFRQDLGVHMAMLVRQGLIEIWHDRRIAAGDNIDDAIDHHLETADLILMLVSPDFLASDYCYAREMTRALERHDNGEARIIPVILRPCDWSHSPLAKLLAVPTDGKPISKWPDKDEALQVVVQAIRAALNAHATLASRSTPAPAASRTLAPPIGSAAPRPRSSNLNIRQEFSDHDRHVFLENAFAYIGNFFEGSLAELKQRNKAVETTFRPIDANHFSAVIFRDGRQLSGCRVWIGNGGRWGSGGIFFSYNDTGSDNGWNESIAAEADSQSLYLKPLGMASIGRDLRDAKLSEEGAAEYFWAMLIAPLQR